MFVLVVRLALAASMVTPVMRQSIDGGLLHRFPDTPWDCPCILYSERFSTGLHDCLRLKHLFLYPGLHVFGSYAFRIMCSPGSGRTLDGGSPFRCIAIQCITFNTPILIQ